MQSPKIHCNVAARLKALESLNVLDTPQEERFDRLTRMAKRMFQVPISLVSVVDENRQWFKSRQGVDASETPRDISFCGHAILGDDIFYIPDTFEDFRFADNPLVIDEPKIRFYAGCPLRSLDGFKIGTLCIIDRKPRTMNEEDMECLRDLAHTVERELAAIQLATRDELTDLINRRGFMSLADSSLKLCARQNMPASLVFMDLNKFKAINDCFGHAEGDRALVNFAQAIEKQCRESDLLARFSGDEFVMLQTNSSKKQSELTMFRFQGAIDKLNREAKLGYDLSFSYGIAEFDPDRHLKVEMLLAQSDAEMYESKTKGSRCGEQRDTTPVGF